MTFGPNIHIIKICSYVTNNYSVYKISFLTLEQTSVLEHYINPQRNYLA